MWIEAVLRLQRHTFAAAGSFIIPCLYVCVRVLTQGVDLDQLLDLSSDQLVELFHARARRRFQRGLKRWAAAFPQLCSAWRTSYGQARHQEQSDMQPAPGHAQPWAALPPPAAHPLEQHYQINFSCFGCRHLCRKPLALIKKLRKAKKEAPKGEKPEPVRTHLRNMIIVPEMIGSVIGVYNGKTFNQVSGQGRGSVCTNNLWARPAARARGASAKMHLSARMLDSDTCWVSQLGEWRGGLLPLGTSCMIIDAQHPCPDIQPVSALTHIWSTLEIGGVAARWPSLQNCKGCMRRCLLVQDMHHEHAYPSHSLKMLPHIHVHVHT